MTRDRPVPAAGGKVRRLARLAGLAGVIGLLQLMPVAAQEIATPGDPLALGAFKVFDAHCARCHQIGRLEAGREKPADSFGNILRLDDLARDPDKVRPGNPDASTVFTAIVEGRMPYDYATTPSGEDLKALAAWIKDLGTKKADACTGRGPVSHTAMITSMAADLEKMPAARRRGTRYLTLTHLYNACTDEKTEMKVYRQGAIKLVNSLSRSSDVVKLETIDPQETIIRINIDDIGWEARGWDLLLAKGKYPYNTQPDTQFVKLLRSATGTPLPYARADWFTFTASQPSLYHDLLKLPTTFQGLLREQQIDIESNLRRFIAQRAGFRNSGVSQNNRLIERHPSTRSGYFWTSYDFEGNKARQDLFEFPLGPGGSGGFLHDGGETIFSLPNGFQAYYLNAADGKRLDQGPTSIVRDPRRGDFTVTNGISCMGCHEHGMINKDDQVRAIVLAGKRPRAVREAVEALYPLPEKMRGVIEADRKRFLGAMAMAGLDPALNFNGTEMITALYKRYESDLDLAHAAAELGLPKEKLADGSLDIDSRFRTLIRRLQQATVPRDTFEQVFRGLVQDVADEEEVKLAGLPQQQSTQRPPRPDPEMPHKPAAVLDLSLTSDKDSYKVGDTPVFTVVTSRDCHLTLSNLDEKGTLTVLFPNARQRDNRIRAGVENLFPGPDAPFRIRTRDRGIETVIAVCTQQNRRVDGIRHDFSRATMTSVDDYREAQARERALVVEAANPQQAQAGKPPAPRPRPADRGRAAIVFEVH